MRYRVGGRSDVERRASGAMVKQLDESDCGVACLASVIRFFGGAETLERLRTLSGTTPTGTTLLGLHHAAENVGLVAEPYRAGVSDLESLDEPAILHVRLADEREHFVVYFGRERGGYLIGDPDTGVATQSEADVAGVWRSHALLLLRPGPQFVRRDRKASVRREWLVRAIRRDARVLAVTTLMGGIVSVLGLATAVFSKALIDNLLPQRETIKLAVGLALLMLVLIAQAGIGSIRSLLLLKQARDFSRRITKDFLSDLFRLPYSFFSTRKTGDLIARLSDTERLQQIVTNVLGSVVINALMVLVGVAYIFVQHAAVGTALLSALSLYAAITRHYHGSILKGQRRVMSAHSANKSGYVESLHGIEDIKAANAEDVFSRLMHDTYDCLLGERYDLGETGVRISLALDVTSALILAGVLTWTAVLVLGESLEVGALVAILQMNGMVLASARTLATANVSLQEASVAFERIYQLTSIPPEFDPEADDRKGRIQAVRRLEVRNLTYRFPGRPALLEDVSLECTRDELVLIMGGTGCGKTSLLRIIQGLHRPEAGRIQVNGCELTDFSVSSWRSAVAVAPQRVQIFSGTVLENIRFGLAMAPAAVVGRCDRLGFSGFFNAFPGGYATMLGPDGVTLSGGQRQLVGLARALVRDAPVLLLDEPTSSMDRYTADAVVDVIDRCRSNKIVIAASHASTLASRADRVYRVEEGRMTLAFLRTGHLHKLTS